MKTRIIVFALLLLPFLLFGADATNVTIPSTPEGVLDSLKEWDAKLANLPFGVLTFMALVAINSILFYVHFFPDRLIPLLSIGLAAFVLTCLASIDPNISRTAFIVKNSMIGVISGSLAWLVAFKWGKPFIEKITKPTPP